MRLYSQTIGEGPNLVLLHGWGFDSRIMLPMANNLASEYRVTVIDLPGFGRSTFDADENFSLEQLIESMRSVLPQHAQYIGWSLGASIALGIARHSLSYIDKLIVMAGSPLFLAQTDWPGVKKEFFAQFVENIQINSTAEMKKFVLLQLHGLNNLSSVYQDIRQFVPAENKNLMAWMSSLRILRDYDFREELKQKELKTQFILGGLDKLIPAAMEEKLRKLNREISIRVIEDATHLPFFTHALETINHIKMFLKSS